MAKIDRALIIVRKDFKTSEELAKTAIESCEEHNLPYEIIDAVQFLPCQEAFKSVGAFAKRNYKNTQGNCCCHSSHIKCWDRIVEIDKPCIILEHDALIVGDVTTIDIPDMAVVTFGHRVAKRNQYTPPRPIEKLVKIKRSVGVHACGLTPKTAKWLSDDAKTNGVGVGVDKWLMMKTESGLPLYVPEPPQAVCWVRGSTSNMQNKEQANQLKTDQRSATVNYRESITPGWNEGQNN